MLFFIKKFWILSVVFLLSGCLVTSALSLATSAVMTVGEIAIKTAGTVVGTVLPENTTE
ncbi:hypothetical protein [Phocoenobacter skyensis]|uniref:Lipoprotein n=1 Tax=Phocoenobacter skyensis TaxID=97481 RepID=A0A1H7ZEC1_9PAST|nr:hypothetical protein [Pasteurella skyensis]MDP8080192.1 hypothetical protein [Pasteurella skyensis]MDP8086186.1 hypothetical protein [Pasteurella skyensis]MDP8170140.1 hypothetical protein [Pasteurella skyensis]MDP8174322.1 hypothetical protein [Pasteurella skyensis]MDP8185914.1 hypothetical protein [Pasteurella skyensis]